MGKAPTACFLAAIMILSISSAIGGISSSQQKQTINTTADAQGSGFYPVYVVEHNLPGGVQWYTYISPTSIYSSVPGTSKSTTTPSIEFHEPPGKYSLSVGSFGHYTTGKLNIQATVSDKPVTVNVFFVKQYNVSVTETGLPQGYNWELTLTNVNNSNDNYGISGPPFRTTQWAYESPGTYTVQIGPALSYVSILGNVGKIRVTAGPVNLTVHFYKVNITEKGINLNITSWGLPYSYYGTFSQTSENGFYPGNLSSFSAYLPNSSYSIHPVATGYYSPTLGFSVTGEPLNLTENFQKAYKVTFIEHNLSVLIAGSWGVTGFPTGYDPSSLYSYGNPVQSFLVPNGTFSFNITGISNQYILNNKLYDVKVTMENTSNSFTVNGKNLTVNLYFNVTTISVKDLQPVNEGQNLLKALLTVMIIGSVAGVTYVYFSRRKKK